MKRAITLALLLILAAALPALSEEAAKTDESPDFTKMDGKELYRSLCKPCHLEDSDAGHYTPMSLIQEQWDAFYDEGFAKAHEDVVCPKDKEKKVVDVFDKDMIKKLRKFCVDHAADSEEPMTCG